MYDQMKHLEMLLVVIERMARNSFLLKGWTVAVAAGLAAAAAAERDPAFVVIGLLPLAAFWSLDAYYLKRERLFRCLYTHVSGLTASEMPCGGPFTMSTEPWEKAVPNWG